MEVLIERMMYASRWLLAPIYFGLSLALIALGIKFFQEIFHLFPHVLEISEADIVLVVLSLIDIELPSKAGSSEMYNVVPVLPALPQEPRVVPPEPQALR